MASNSIAPSVKSVDLYDDAGTWKLALYAADGATQIASTSINGVAIGAAGSVAFSAGAPLDLRKLGGDAAHEIRVTGAGVLMVRHASPLGGSAFSLAALTVATGEVLGQQVESIASIGAGITRLRIAWGG